MSGISTIVFNGSNAYELSTGHKATSWPQGAVGIEQVSAGVQLRSPTAGAGMILRIRAIGTNGLLISELSQTHILTVLNNWERAEKTFTLPAGTVKIELRLVSVGGAVLFAQPKLANGSAVGAYATNFAPQLTMITPTGIYTGTVTAEQIILTGGERLPDRLLTLNASLISLRSGIDGTNQTVATISSSMISLRSDLDGDGVRISQLEAGSLKLGNRYNGVKIDQDSGINIASLISGKSVEIRLNTSEGLAYYSAGSFVGGLKLVDGQVSSVAGVVTGDSNLKRYVKVGSLPTGGGGLAYYNRNIFSQQNKFIFAITELVGGSFAIVDSNDKQRVSILVDGSVHISDLNGTVRFSVLPGGEFRCNDDAGHPTVWISKSGNFAQLHLPSSIDNAIGVDATGAYKIVHGTKTYL